MKKLVSLLLALVMVFSLAAAAFADDNVSLVDEDETGSITINGIAADTTYEIYRLLDLESYNRDSGVYSYTVNAAWSAFFATDAAKAYFTVDEQGYATWTAENEANPTVAAFAQLALAYAKENGIAPVKSSENSGEFSITGTEGKFSDLVLGYYLVDSSAGALCGLTTADPDASINAKNGTPIVDKQVQEDLTGNWGDKNTADIGQIVNFKSIIHVAPGAENFVLHDNMSDGLTFVHNTADGRGVTEIKLTNSLGVTTTLTEGDEYTVEVAGVTDDCDFEVKFADDYVATLKPNDRIEVFYNAMLNRHAVVGDAANPNETWLDYGEEKHTTHDTTETFTFSIDIIKTDSSNKLIDGAEFRIYDAATGGNEIEVVLLLDANDENPFLDAQGNPVYRRARADETGVPIVVKDGKVTVVGFDNGVYYLEETKTPAGYNQLAGRQEFTIADKNLDSVFNDGIYSTGSGVHVVNKSGTMLPETGAMGTTMFIIFGTFVVLGTGVLLVTKKRMSMIED